MTPRSWAYRLSVLCMAAALAAACGQGTTETAADAEGGTPRTPWGHPDFNGIWGGGGGGGGVNANDPEEDSSNVVALLNARNNEADFDAPVGTDRNYGLGIVNFERDSGILQRSDPNRPIYKPEYWDKVQQLDHDGNALDPAFRCLPEGVPRMGPPDKIVQTERELIFLYGLRMTRIIPIDGRTHPPVEEWLGLWNGRSIGRWEGETLVIETVDFNDESWLDWPGWFHSIDMKVTERMRREGDMLHWEATVEDPVLQEPWVVEPVVRRLNPNPMAELEEDLPCFERDLEHMVTKERG
jgi:hypothetical protein